MTRESDRTDLNPAEQDEPPRANSELVELAESLMVLPLTHVEPMLGAPQWR